MTFRRGRRPNRWAILVLLLFGAVVAGLLITPLASGISAPIQIANTGGQGVNMRPTPDTSQPRVGWIPEGASPDYNCWTQGQNINGVDVWFNVNYGGATGYYAS